jgi:hypothetical protein
MKPSKLILLLDNWPIYEMIMGSQEHNSFFK